jgi:hypothetical protein
MSCSRVGRINIKWIQIFPYESPSMPVTGLILLSGTSPLCLSTGQRPPSTKPGTKTTDDYRPFTNLR